MAQLAAQLSRVIDGTGIFWIYLHSRFHGPNVSYLKHILNTGKHRWGKTKLRAESGAFRACTKTELDARELTHTNEARRSPAKGGINSAISVHSYGKARRPRATWSLRTKTQDMNHSVYGYASIKNWQMIAGLP